MLFAVKLINNSTKKEKTVEVDVRSAKFVVSAAYMPGFSVVNWWRK